MSLLIHLLKHTNDRIAEHVTYVMHAKHIACTLGTASSEINFFTSSGSGSPNNVNNIVRSFS